MERELKRLLNEKRIIGYSIEKDGTIIVIAKNEIPELKGVKLILIKDDIKAL